MIRNADGFPTYHFAVVVDDEDMRITHVLRGQEHLYNTPKHVVLQDLLGYRRPVYAHLSLIFNPDGSKMSKRDKDKTLRRFVKDHEITRSSVVDPEVFDAWAASPDTQLEHDAAEALAAELGVHLPEINVDDFRRSGYLPETLCNYLALLGWSPGGDLEHFDTDVLVERFNLERLVKGPARVGRDKLLNFKLVRLQGLSEQQYIDRLRTYCRETAPEFVERLQPEAFELMARANHERSKTLADAPAGSRFLIAADEEIVYDAGKAVRKAMDKGEPSGWDHLERVRGVLAGIDAWTVASLEEAVRLDAEAHAEGRLGQIAQPLRIAVSGGTVSPPIFDVLALLGRERVLARIDRFLACRESLFAGWAGPRTESRHEPRHRRRFGRPRPAGEHRRLRGSLPAGPAGHARGGRRVRGRRRRSRALDDRAVSGAGGPPSGVRGGGGRPAAAGRGGRAVAAVGAGGGGGRPEA